MFLRFSIFNKMMWSFAMCFESLCWRVEKGKKTLKIWKCLLWAYAMSFQHAFTKYGYERRIRKSRVSFSFNTLQLRILKTASLVYRTSSFFYCKNPKKANDIKSSLTFWKWYKKKQQRLSELFCSILLWWKVKCAQKKFKSN